MNGWGYARQEHELRHMAGPGALTEKEDFSMTETITQQRKAQVAERKVQRERDQAAAQRLCLPGPRVWTIGEAEEAHACIGCTGRYERGVRVVRCVKGCPAHGVRS